MSGPCAECGGEVDLDRYCLRCGIRAPHPRDHFREQPAAWVAGVCDRGVVKQGNEDAMALAASERPGEHAVLVVLDGVSLADDSAAAALAGARAAREVLWPITGTDGPTTGAPSGVDPLLAATTAADDAVRAHSDPASSSPASATFLAVVLERGRVRHGNLGDSRAYWLPDAGDAAQLTTDDAIGHGLTKWLGRDSPDPSPRVGELDLAGPGWLVVCTDGLWHYADTAAALQARVTAAGAVSPEELAASLLRFAREAGGHDNITVAVARVGGIGDNGENDAEAGESIDG